MTQWMMKKSAEVPCRGMHWKAFLLGTEGSHPGKGPTLWNLLENFPQEWCIQKLTSMVLKEAVSGDVLCVSSGCHLCRNLVLQEPSKWAHQNQEEKPLSPKVAASTLSWQSLIMCQMTEEKWVQLHYHRAGNKDGFGTEWQYIDNWHNQPRK